MRLMQHELAQFLMAKHHRREAGSLASLAEEAGLPIGTLKTRVKSLMGKGLTREDAIRQALKKPIGPQGRPRRSDR